jgi:molybdopterin-containing oxidoreductase family membrane subunit
MATKSHIMGFFKDEHQAAATVREMETSPWTVKRVHSPIPSHVLEEALKLKPSKVGYFTLAGGIIGFFTGFCLAIFTALRWSLIVSGKPVMALVPFFIVGFEFTVLFAVFGNVIGFISQARLPRLSNLEQYDPRCSGEYFGILATCPTDQQEGLADFFRTQGGEVRVLN